MPEIGIAQGQAVLLVGAVFFEGDAVALDGGAEMAVGDHGDIVPAPAGAQRQGQSEERIDITAGTDCHEYKLHG